jgi:hypothetical protein
MPPVGAATSVWALSVGIVGIGMFGAFFFLTYFLQQTLRSRRYRPASRSCPMVAAVMATASTTSTALLPRMGPRPPLMTVGMVLAAAGSVLLAQLGVHSGYAAHVLPALILVGIGLGLVMAPAMNTATLGVRAADAGVASATVNTMQQVGGSIGTALRRTLAASATTSYLDGKQPTAAVAAEATVHGYTTAFRCAAAIFAGGAVVCGLLLRSGAPAHDPNARPALAA